MKTSARAQSLRGFTLIELLVVVMVIAILASITLGIAGLAQRKAGENRALSDMEQLRMALEEYRLEYNTYPSESDYGSETIRSVLTNMIPDVSFVDPWLKDYLYERQSRFQYTLASAGPDGIVGNEDDLKSGSKN